MIHAYISHAATYIYASLGKVDHGAVRFEHSIFLILLTNDGPVLVLSHVTERACDFAVITYLCWLEPDMECVWVLIIVGRATPSGNICNTVFLSFDGFPESIAGLCSILDFVTS